MEIADTTRLQKTMS